jgi:hypothetical protein
VPGASKLVRVSLLEPVPRDDTVRQALRWEATGIMGGLFPVLDADLTLIDQLLRAAAAPSMHNTGGERG